MAIANTDVDSFKPPLLQWRMETVTKARSGPDIPCMQMLNSG